MPDLFLRPLFTWRSALASPNGPANPITRLVLLTISLHMSERGDSCFPSTRTIAGESGLSHRSVITHIETAERDGWLGKKQRRTVGKGWRRMEYVALIPAGFKNIETFHGAHGDEPDSPREGDAAGASALADGGESGAHRGERGAHGDEPDDIPLTMSTSKSTSVSTPTARARKKRKPETQLPADFCISSRVRAWAKENGHGDLDKRFEHFVGKVKAKGYTYVDWDEGFMGAVRENWAKLGAKGTAGQGSDASSTGAPDPQCTGTMNDLSRCQNAAVSYPGRSKKGFCSDCAEVYMRAA